MAEADVLAHIHIPKTAGTSVRLWLYAAYPNGFGSLYPNDDFDEESLAAAGLGNLAMRAFSTHNIRRFPPTCCGRTMRYFTLLREPVKHMLSNVLYLKQTYAALPQSVRNQYPADTDRMSSRELASLLDAIHPASFAWQTNFLAEKTWHDRAIDPADSALYLRERLNVAKDILREFAVVGTVERLPESLEMLRARSAAWGFVLPSGQEVGFENVTRVRGDDTAWIGKHDSVGKRVLELNADDFELYAFAQELLGETLRKV